MGREEVDGLLVWGLMMHTIAQVEVTDSMDPGRVFLPCVVESVSLLEQLESGFGLGMTGLELEVSSSVERNLSRGTDRMERDSVLEVERTTSRDILELWWSLSVIHELYV